MRVAYFSDIHLEIRATSSRVPWTETYPLDLGPDLSRLAGTVDLAVMAGDIATIRPYRGVSVIAYAEQVAAFLGCPVVLVPGNHEFYHGEFDADRAELLAAKVPSVIALDRGEAYFPHSAGRLRVLGTTLWTDYRCAGDQEVAMLEARLRINDHRLIRRGGQVFLPADALEEHERSRAWLAEKLAEPHEGPTLIVTHHVPHSVARHPQFKLDAIGAAFASDCDELIAAAAAIKAAGWIFGHHHWSHTLQIGGLRLLSAQLGYPSELTDWDGPGILEI